MSSIRRAQSSGFAEMLEPFQGRVYDPCCGSGNVCSVRGVQLCARSVSGTTSHLGQEFVGTTWRLAKMNLALRGIDANLGDRSDDSFHRDRTPDLRADFVTNPPSQQGRLVPEALADDSRWKYGLARESNANSRLASTSSITRTERHGFYFVLANGSLSKQSVRETLDATRRSRSG